MPTKHLRHLVPLSIEHGYVVPVVSGYHPGNNLRGVMLGGPRGRGLVVLLRNEAKFWYKAPCCCFLVDGCCYFLVSSGWSL